MVQGMSAPPVVPTKPQPKPQLGATTEFPIPEFMWCQRSDKVYLTIKVADCADAVVEFTEGVVYFRGTGHGMCGQRQYRINIELAGAIIPAECVWFVSGPNVRVRLQKDKVGPYWGGLLAGKRKMVQLKVDWSSWLDEDEENERSAAPNGFDEAAMTKVMVNSDKDALYRDLDRFDSTTSPDEGEEQNSIIIDEGLNNIDDIQIKFKALDYERTKTSKTKAARQDLRKRTREAVLFQKKRENDLKYGRAVREITEEELTLIANEPGLYEKLKAEKKQEKAFWLSKWWHVRRPEKKKIDQAEPLARAAAVETTKEELAKLKAAGGDISDKKTRLAVERAVFIASRQAAMDKFNQWDHQSEKPDRIRKDQEGRDYTARDMGARFAREEVAKALGEPEPELAQSLQLKQFADPRPEGEKPQLPEGYGGDDDDDDSDDEDDSDGPELELEGNDGDGPTLELEDNDGEPTLELEENDGEPTLELEDNDGEPTLELEGNDGDGPTLELEDNDGEPTLELEENDGDGLELEDNVNDGTVV